MSKRRMGNSITFKGREAARVFEALSGTKIHTPDPAKQPPLQFERCVMATSGIDLSCPLCGLTVVSGITHSCKRVKEPK